MLKEVALFVPVTVKPDGVTVTVPVPKYPVPDAVKVAEPIDAPSALISTEVWFSGIVNEICDLTIEPPALKSTTPGLLVVSVNGMPPEPVGGAVWTEIVTRACRFCPIDVCEMKTCVGVGWMLSE